MRIKKESGISTNPVFLLLFLEIEREIITTSYANQEMVAVAQLVE